MTPYTINMARQDEDGDKGSLTTKTKTKNSDEGRVKGTLFFRISSTVCLIVWKFDVKFKDITLSQASSSNLSIGDTCYIHSKNQSE